MDIAHQRTRTALFWMGLIGEPFVALMTILPFILRKDLGASEWELSILAAVRPVLSVFSFYWSSNLSRDPGKLRSNLIFAWLFSRLPFFLFPLFTSVWYAIFATACYQLFYRASTPALMEILKVNIPKTPREKLFTWVYAAGFIESIFLSLFLGKWLDGQPGVWQWLFCGASLLSLLSIPFQMRIPLPSSFAAFPQVSLWKKIINPWKESYTLLRAHRGFAQFQWGFMLGGLGLMVMTPALPIYYADVLVLNHEQVSLARCLWMAAGVVLSSAFWRMALSQLSPQRLSVFVCCAFALFPLSLLIAKYDLSWFYLAFLIYGIGQAGSHLLWNMSGPLFAGESDSSRFTSVNVLMVGLRGLIGPVTGGVLSVFWGTVPALLIGALLCAMGGWKMLSSPASVVLKSAD